MKPQTEIMAAATGSPATLGYAPGALRRKRRRIRWVITLALLLVAIAGGWRWAPAITARVALLYWQRQCATYEAPAGVTLYQTDPAEAAKLLKTSDDYKQRLGSGDVFLYPRCVDKFESLCHQVPSFQNERFFRRDRPVVLFAHELCSPSGKRRIVIVSAEQVINRSYLVGDLDFRVYIPATLFSPAKDVTPDRKSPYPFSYIPVVLEAGRADPADSSHLTIPYSSDGESGMIDGRLTDRESINFVDR